jgi:fatty acid-binding protein DegV
MAGYREDRRTDAVRPLAPITKNEAGELSDLNRTRQYEKAREAIADDVRKQGGKKKNFADLVKKKK